ncbi:endonuclease/exonuclease/phosphatase family protein [Mycolicibacterium farcinogenes]|uniref:endonuclease/exonuclease/phosphatase family protein n=1 Tax=Mycolicibacterium farcinogenes TaxID=1802 RepID=UPI001C8DCB31|nr:endonuclease/exonuclease/phosphatase family protein [Mycolicibacterium farcinogenes]QZH57661.1 endonuclease/exonuclease/phosphatase family protein [Mycolicibacterium farcinogenes]
MTLRIATLNIRHGGSKNADAVAARLLGNDVDLLVVTEFRANHTGLHLVTQLERAGYSTTHPGADSKQNTVLIASRTPIDRAARFSRDLSAHHVWCVEFDGTIAAGVYLPQAQAKLPYWEALIDRARRSEVDLLIGDFNTGNNDLDKDPKGTKFVGPEMPDRLIASGYVDIWRALHPSVREYSWFIRPGDNGFRLDYIYAVPEFARRVRTCEFDHAPRLTRETDHSGLVAVLD